MVVVGVQGYQPVAGFPRAADRYALSGVKGAPSPHDVDRQRLQPGGEEFHIDFHGGSAVLDEPVPVGCVAGRFLWLGAAAVLQVDASDAWRLGVDLDVADERRDRRLDSRAPGRGDGGPGVPGVGRPQELGSLHPPANLDQVGLPRLSQDGMISDRVDSDFRPDVHVPSPARGLSGQSLVGEDLVPPVGRRKHPGCSGDGQHPGLQAGGRVRAGSEPGDVRSSNVDIQASQVERVQAGDVPRLAVGKGQVRQLRMQKPDMRYEVLDIGPGWGGG